MMFGVVGSEGPEYETSEIESLNEFEIPEP